MNKLFLLLILSSLIACIPEKQEIEALQFGDKALTGNDLGGNVITSKEAFEQTLYPILRNNCAGCHDAAQMPKHANSDVNSAHNAITSNDLVDLDAPADSLISTKLSGENHNCWSNCADDAQEIADAIDDWADLLAANNNTGGGSGGDDCNEPFIRVNDTIVAYEQTVYPIVQQYCAGCHGGNQTPNFAQEDTTAGWGVIEGAGNDVIHFDNVSDSKLVTRLRDDEHNCWSFNCEDNAVEMETAITQFVNLYNETIPNPACNQ